MLGSFDPRVLGSSDPRVLGSSDPRVLGSSDPRVLGSSDPRVLGSSNLCCSRDILVFVLVHGHAGVWVSSWTCWCFA